MQVINRVGPPAPAPVALETTLLVHGVPAGQGKSLARELSGIVRARRGTPAIVGVVDGTPIVGLNEDELDRLLSAPAPEVPKLNTSNLGLALHRKSSGATTVSATMELAAAAGVRVFATGGIGGVHRGYGARWDISADLAALARFPVAVVGSGVKSLLDVEATREALETLGVPVVGFRTDRFPAFYLRQSAARIDARFDEPCDLAQFVRAEMGRTGRGVLVANPVPEADEISAAEWDRWHEEAQAQVASSPAFGRDITPAILKSLHEVSGGRTLRANLALVRSNTDLAAQVASAMAV